MYACSTWYIRAQGLRGPQRAAEAAARSIQYQALHRISGAFRRTSREALEVCLHVDPPELTLARLAEEACLRLMTSPLRHQMHTIRGNSPRSSLLTSPLHRLEAAVDARLGRGTCERIETIDPFVVPPWWQPPETTISEDREAALKAYSQATSGLQFFTDGSGFDNGIGASAYSRLGSSWAPVGSSETHTVYAGELEGIYEALTILGRHYNHAGPRRATIYTDNRAAIQACSAPRRSSGQYILRRIVMRLDWLRVANWQIHIQWVPGHEGVPGNEIADRLAKHAAQDAASRTRRTLQHAIANHPPQDTPRAARMMDPRFPQRDVVLVAVCRQHLRAGFATQWKRQWQVSEHGRHLHRIIAAPVKKVLALHTGLARAWSSVLVQLQTGKSALRSFLASVKIADSPLCQCGLGPQDSAHVLTRCPRYRQLRQQTLWKEGRETDTRRLLSEPAWAKKSIEFALKTGLLTQFRRVFTPVSRLQ